MQPVITLLDTNGNIVSTSDQASVDVFNNSDCTTPAVGSLSGNKITANKGVATFSNLAFGAAQTFYLQYNLGGISSCVDAPIATSHPGFSGVFDFPSAENYTFDPNQLFVSNGVCRLASVDQVDKKNESDNASVGFAGGTHALTAWDEKTLALKASVSKPSRWGRGYGLDKHGGQHFALPLRRKCGRDVICGRLGSEFGGSL
ncbi:hypothetical protein WDW86_06495 [Bdellovibrionota bacterium FG-2]